MAGTDKLELVFLCSCVHVVFVRVPTRECDQEVREELAKVNQIDRIEPSRVAVLDGCGSE